MLTTRQKTGQSGFTLIELMVAVVILGILSTLAFPSFQTMLRNTQVRNAAESVLNGLQRTRAQAVALNNNVSFTLGNDSSWVIRDVIRNQQIEERVNTAEGSKNVTVTTIGNSTITFNNVGGVVAAAAVQQFDFEAEGSDRPLRVVVGLGGSVRMCDPNLPSSNTGACN